MAYFGVQAKGDEMKGPLCAAFQKIRQTLTLTDGPARHDLVQFLDAEGYLNLIVVAYWQDPKKHLNWSNFPEVAGWWNSDDRLHEGIGYFREVLSPRMEQFETIFTHDYGPFEGVSILFGNMSQPIFGHGYWGFMRDRLPVSQNDTMEPTGKLTVTQGQPKAGGRVVISGHQNLTLIRSGEDWSRTKDEERRVWYEDIEPVLHQGMNFLPTTASRSAATPTATAITWMSMAICRKRGSASAFGTLSPISSIGESRIPPICRSS